MLRYQLEGIDTNFLLQSETHSYNTRNKDTISLFYLNQAKKRTEYMKRTFKYTSITLSRKIQNSDSSFKRHNHLMLFYSLDVFIICVYIFCVYIARLFWYCVYLCQGVTSLMSEW